MQEKIEEVDDSSYAKKFYISLVCQSSFDKAMSFVHNGGARIKKSGGGGGGGGGGVRQTLKAPFFVTLKVMRRENMDKKGKEKIREK